MSANDVFDWYIISTITLIAASIVGVLYDYVTTIQCTIILMGYAFFYLMLTAIRTCRSRRGKRKKKSELSNPSLQQPIQRINNSGIYQMRQINGNDTKEEEKQPNINENLDQKPVHKLFDYDNVTLLDDTDKVISLLKNLSTDMNCALNTIESYNYISLESYTDECEQSKQTEHTFTTNNNSNIQSNIIDSDWRTSICNNVNTKIWGSYSQCTATTLKLRGPNYLSDRMKTTSKESVFTLANIEMFTTESNMNHIAQNKMSWFYKNRYKLPRSLLFVIIHLRLDSIKTSVVQYFYIDRNKYNYLLQTGKCNEMLKTKGNGYFAVNDKAFDESGMLWNFINGECKYRNDRLKLIARKHEGPFFLYIPSKPAILGRKVPIRYCRGYNGKQLNGIRMDNTRSNAYETYDFKMLCHDENETKMNMPCDDCGACEWVNTNGEYADYLELDISPEVNVMARNIIRMACPLAKSLQIEMHWTLESQNNVELPERMLCSARLTHIDLNKVEKCKIA